MPAASTVNMPDAAEALPARMGPPTSDEFHGAGRVWAIAALSAAHTNSTAVSSARKSLLIELLHRRGVEQRSCRKQSACALDGETNKAGAFCVCGLFSRA